ncbi:hypothetical protein ACLMJK_009229 [Lecanora helva]
MDESSGGSGLVIEVPLEINNSRINDLGLFDRKSPEPTPSKPFEHDSTQLLTQGSSLGAKLQSRLKLVKFGEHTSSCGCLIVITIDFTPKSYTGVLRFRDAAVQLKVGPGNGERPDNEGPAESTEISKREPKIMAWHPKYLEGPAKSTLESYNFSIDSSAIPPAFGGPSIGPNLGYSMSRERLKRRRIHGTIQDDEQRILEWKLEENKSAGDGIPPACTFACVSKVDEEEGFHLRLGIRAITVAGLPVVGKNDRAIYFASGEYIDSVIPDTATQASWASAVKDQTFAGENQKIDLAKIDLAKLTQAEEMIQKA